VALGPIARGMLIGAAFLVCLLTVPLARGRLSALADLSFRHAWLLPAAFAIQLAIVYVVPHWPHAVLNVAHMATYGFAATFAVLNRRVPGLLVVATGGLSNFIAISANGGVMPASPSALATAGLADTPGQFASSAGLSDPNILFLGDVFAVPASWPVHNVYSVGDVLIVVGALVMVHAATGSRLAGLVRRPAAQAG
jgi:hypothetical protein